MMLATEPGCLSLCLDAHWVYRGAGHSQVALFDVVKLYGQRVAELHLRQSKGNVWSETFGDGDIDYRALWKALAGSGVEPLLVLEQGPEQGTPQTIEIAEAHRAQLPLRERGVLQEVLILGGLMRWTTDTRVDSSRMQNRRRYDLWYLRDLCAGLVSDVPPRRAR